MPWSVPIPHTPPTASTNTIEVIEEELTPDPDNPGGFVWAVIREGVLLDSFIHPGFGTSYAVLITEGGVPTIGYSFNYLTGRATFTTQKSSEDQLVLKAWRPAFLRGASVVVPGQTVASLRDTAVTGEQLDLLVGAGRISLHQHAVPSTTAPTSDPPTNSELTGIFGDPNVLGDGFLAIVNPGGSGSGVTLVFTLGGLWWVGGGGGGGGGHSPVTVSGTPDYLTLSGQELVRGQIDLATDVLGDLPYANLVQASAASRLLGRGSAAEAGDWEEITLGSGLTMTGTELSAAGGGVTDHGALTGLSDDDHTQYALLAGRSPAQTLKGGTGSAQHLTLQSTAHATRGAIRIDGDKLRLTGLNLTGAAFAWEGGIYGEIFGSEVGPYIIISPSPGGSGYYGTGPNFPEGFAAQKASRVLAPENTVPGAILTVQPFNNNAAGTGDAVFGLFFSGGSNAGQVINGLRYEVGPNPGSGSIAQLTAVLAGLRNTATAVPVTDAAYFRADPFIWDAGTTLTSVHGLTLPAITRGTNRYGVRIRDLTANTGTIAYGVLIEDFAGAVTTQWPIFYGVPGGTRRFGVDRQGLVYLPVFSDATRPAAGVAGRMIYNSTDGGINVDNGANWRAPSGGWVNT